MIQSLSIHNFQSLTDVQLDLGPLTVIVGRSSSGKSALIRSLNALIQNRRGTEFITHGERTASISATIVSTDPLRCGTVTLTRSTQAAPNSYVILPTDPKHPLHPKAEFTKLGGDVPADVSRFLGISPALAPLVVASQFDKPYLLDAPGTEVARTFASLTNAHVILNGARESNRRKLTASQTLRTRASDLEAIVQRIPEFQSLKAQREALDQAEALIAEARLIASQIQNLQVLIDTVEIAEQRIPALRATAASIPTAVDIDTDVTALRAAQTRLTRYTESIQAISTAQTGVQRAKLVVSQTADSYALALEDVAGAMQDVASGFAAYFTEHGTTLIIGEDGRTDIDIRDAANLAARYVAQLDG